MNARLYIPKDSAAIAVGADEVAGAFTAHGIQAIRTGSRGLYWLEPMIEVETPEGRIAYGPVAAEDVEGLIAADVMEGGDHTLRLGRPDEIPFLKRQTRLTFARCGVVDPLSLDDYRAHAGYKGLERALTMQPAAIVEAVIQSGLRGRGGAGFPTGIKWKTVLDTPGERKYIVCNADEGDSGTFADRMLIEGDPFALIEGMTIAALAVGATQGYIYLRVEYPHAQRALEAAIDAAGANGPCRTRRNASHLFPESPGSWRARWYC